MPLAHFILTSLLILIILILLMERIKARTAHNKTKVRVAIVRALARKQREWNELRDLVLKYYGHRVGDIGPILFEMEQEGIIQEFWGKSRVSEELHGATIVPRMYKLIKED